MTDKTPAPVNAMGGAHLPAPVHETATTAAASQAKAQVEARYLMALQRPRDIDEVRVRILKECRRPRFAESAIYAKPVGGRKIEGLSIRFVEAALRALGNVHVEAPTLYEDEAKRIVRVMVTDLESNVTHSSDLSINKTVERHRPRDGQEVLGERENTKGETVYIVRATEDELANKVGAQLSKALRNNGLRLLPGDIAEEAEEWCRATMRDRDAQDPDAARKRVVDGFASIGVKPGDLKLYLGHDVGTASPAELEDLRATYAAVRDGETSWSEALRQRQEAHADKTAAGRDRDTLDAKDVAKVRTVVGAQAEEHGVDSDVILADLLSLDDPAEAAAKLPSVPKADLPKLLKAAKAWKPAATTEGGEQQEELPT